MKTPAHLPAPEQRPHTEENDLDKLVHQIEQDEWLLRNKQLAAISQLAFDVLRRNAGPEDTDAEIDWQPITWAPIFGKVGHRQIAHLTYRRGHSLTVDYRIGQAALIIELPDTGLNNRDIPARRNHRISDLYHLLLTARTSDHPVLEVAPTPRK